MSDQRSEPTTPPPAAPPAPPEPGTRAGFLSPRFLETMQIDAAEDPVLRHLMESWNNAAAPSANELADALLYACNRFKLFRDEAAAARPAAPTRSRRRR